METTCFFCEGSAHPANGCQYTANVVACGSCVRGFWTWFVPFANGKGRRPRRSGQPQPVVNFYEAAARFQR